jgi:diaminopimelate decarboxylase
MGYGVKLFGQHAFFVSNALTDKYDPKLAEILFKTAAELHGEPGAEIAFINLSGGIGIPYRPEQREVDLVATVNGVKEAFERVLVPAGMGNVKVFSELGRYMLAPYGCLVAKAIHEKNTHKEYIGLDACSVDLMRPSMYGAYHHITVSGKENEPCDYQYDITGSLCENNDKFAIDRMLPKIQLGDLLIIHDTGAHGYSMGSNYNGKLKSKELLLCEDGSVRLIRRAETPQDYFATLEF